MMVVRNKLQLSISFLSASGPAQVWTFFLAITEVIIWKRTNKNSNINLVIAIWIVSRIENIYLCFSIFFHIKRIHKLEFFKFPLVGKIFPLQISLLTTPTVPSRFWMYCPAQRPAVPVLWCILHSLLRNHIPRIKALFWNSYYSITFSYSVARWASTSRQYWKII